MLLTMRPTGGHSHVYADRQEWTILDEGRPVGRIHEDTSAYVRRPTPVLVDHNAVQPMRVFARAAGCQRLVQLRIGPPGATRNGDSRGIGQGRAEGSDLAAAAHAGPPVSEVFLTGGQCGSRDGC
jgi:hypothetical protein